MTSPAAQGLFLDLDGTLADSMPVLRQVYFRFLEELGRQGSDQEFDALAGRPLGVIVPRLMQVHGLEDAAPALMAAYYGLIGQVYQTHARPTPGARQLLEAARRQGVRVAVVTSSDRAMAHGFLAHSGLAPLVDQVVTTEDTPRGKPAPDPYLRALALTGLGPDKALAVEDTALGASAALAAGIATYIVGPAGERPWVEGAAGYLDSLDQLIPRLAG